MSLFVLFVLFLPSAAELNISKKYAKELLQKKLASKN